MDKDFLFYGIANDFQLLPTDTTVVSAEMKNYSSAVNPSAKPLVEATIRTRCWEDTV